MKSKVFQRICIVFFLASFAGSRNVYAIEWDMNTSGGNNPFFAAMEMMLDAFGIGDNYQWGKANPLQSSKPYNPMSPQNPMNMGGMPMPVNPMSIPSFRKGPSRALPSWAQPKQGQSEWFGIWQSNTGAVLMIHPKGMARLYMSKTEFEDYQVRVNENEFFLKDQTYGKIKRYEYALKQGRLILRDKSGNLLLFRKFKAKIK